MSETESDPGFRIILQFFETTFTLLKVWGRKLVPKNKSGRDSVSQSQRTKLLNSYLTMIPRAGERINSLSASLKMRSKISESLFYRT